jgi:hypothetical protein
VILEQIEWRLNMAENPPEQSPGSSVRPSSNEQQVGSSASIEKPISRIFVQPQPIWIKRFLEWFAGVRLYGKYKPYARNVKIALQMLIGLIIVVLLLAEAFFGAINVLGHPVLVPFATLNPLKLVAYGLFFSSGVELAYMLFTPGPDEVLEPVMMGLAAAILLGVSNIDFSNVNVQEGVTLFLAVGALAGLFAVKKYLYKAEKDEE